MLNPNRLREICNNPISYFQRYGDVQHTRDGPLIFRDNGADLLAVAHLDYVDRGDHFYTVEHNGELIIVNTHLDDRLGAYVLLDILPRLDVKFDLLLTDGEERGRSTAAYFQAPRTYNWMFSFDRAGTDIVLYDYEEPSLVEALEEAGGFIGVGSFSDVCFLDHLGVAGINFGTGYENNHMIDSHAVWSDTEMMIRIFLEFWRKNATRQFKYDPMATPPKQRWTLDTGPEWRDERWYGGREGGRDYRWMSDRWVEVEDETYIQDMDDLEAELNCLWCGKENCLGVIYCESCGAPQHNDRQVLETGICGVCARTKDRIHRRSEHD